LQRIYQQPRVNKLVWEKPIILIVEDGSSFYCPRRSVNLVVDRQQLSACDFRLPCAIKGIDAELNLRAQASFNRAQTVFLDGENDSDGSQLGDDCQSYGQLVRKGDPLMDIDSRLYRATLLQAQGALERDEKMLAQAQMDLERYRAAWARNAIAKQIVDDQEKLVQKPTLKWTCLGSLFQHTCRSLWILCWLRRWSSR
jgi:hypothetical protein